MGSMHRFLIALAALMVLCLGAPPAWSRAKPFRARVVRVYDGDSFAVKTLGSGRRRVEVRLFGVDCPEMGQPWHDQAGKFTARLLHKTVRVAPVSRDRHGRVVARVYLADGRELNLLLLRQGLAWWFSWYAPRQGAYARAWWRALKEGRGLWGDARPQMRPADWRRMRR